MKYFLLGVFIVEIFFFYGCKRNPYEEATQLQTCSSFFGCSGDNICLSKVNICVKPCKIDGDCPTNFRCNGYFKNLRKFSGLGSKFCRLSIRKKDEKCVSIKDGCKKGLSCVDNICRTICEEDEDCDFKERCIMDVLSSSDSKSVKSYRVCAKAILNTNNKCENGKEPFCTKGNICIDGKCRKLCEKNDDCGKKENCSGKGFLGWKGKLRYLKGFEGDIKYCIFQK